MQAAWRELDGLPGLNSQLTVLPHFHDAIVVMHGVNLYVLGNLSLNVDQTHSIGTADFHVHGADRLPRDGRSCPSIIDGDFCKCA